MGERFFQQEFMCSFEENEAALLSYDVIQRAVRDDVQELTLDYGDDGESPLSYREDVHQLDQINELNLDYGDDFTQEDEETLKSTEK